MVVDDRRASEIVDSDLNYFHRAFEITERKHPVYNLQKILKLFFSSNDTPLLLNYLHIRETDALNNRTMYNISLLATTVKRLSSLKKAGTTYYFRLILKHP